MVPSGNVSLRRVAWAWSLGLLLGAPGCTICPDPFDYSGPVPNGSAPQNDFRARSNGIAPTGGVPRPWPPVVEAEPERRDRSDVVTTAVETGGPAAVTTRADVIQPAVAQAADERGVTAPEDDPVVEAPAFDEVAPPAAPARRDHEPARAETPGWRPRG